MGLCCGGEPVEPERSYNDQQNPYDGNRNYQDEPEIFARKRSCTNVIFLIIYTVFIAALLGLLIYAGVNGDIRRIINGYDECGNICGVTNSQENVPQVFAECAGADMTKKSFMTVVEDSKNSRRTCMRDCSDIENYFTMGKRCLPINLNQTSDLTKAVPLGGWFDEVSQDFSSSTTEIIILSFTALAFSVAILVLFRFAIGIIVWIILVGSSLALIGVTGYLWYSWYQMTTETTKENSEQETTYLILAILAAIVTIIVLLVILIMRKRIKLVVQLFKEAGRAIGSMPLLLLQPFLTFVIIAGVISAFIYFLLLIESAGTLTQGENGKIFYRKDAVIQITRWYNLMAFFWFSQFIIGCQHIVIASAVAIWFFSRNKSKLIGSYASGYYNLGRYHLGTVVLGSLLIALIYMIKVLLQMLKAMLSTVKCGRAVVSAFECCCNWICCCCAIKDIVQFISRNAYIQTAITGKSFCGAAERAFGLIANNALVVLAINSVGDFVLFLGKLLVTGATIAVGVEIFKGRTDVYHSWVLITLFGVIAFFIAHCFLTVYEMAIDTIFQCFCIDCEENDGMNRPYYMSRGLMDYMKKGNAVQKDKSHKQDAWSKEGSRAHPPNTIS